MPTAWEVLKSNSILTSGTAWEHLNAQVGGGGFDEEIIVHGDGLSISVDQTSLVTTIESSVSELSLAIEPSQLSTSIDDTGIDIGIVPDQYSLSISGSLGGEGIVITQMTSAETLAALLCVTTNTSGQIYRCTGTEVISGKNIIGITAQAFAPLETNRVYISDDTVEDISWSWDITKPIYAADNGTLTQAPTLDGFVQIVGVPLSITSMRVRVEPPIILEE